jgi:predicted Zn-dependent protease
MDAIVPRIRHRSLFLPLLLALVAGCAEREPLPPLPDVAFDDVSGPVAEQLEESLAAARAADADATANGRLGMVLQAYLRLPAAEVAYRRARRLDPGVFQWCYLHGVVLQALGSSAEAIATLSDALELRPGYVPAELRLAALQVEAGQPESARALYAAILERWPDSAPANLGLGRLLLGEGDAEAALEPLMKAARAAPDAGAVHYALAQAYAALGDADSAATHTARFEAAETREPPVTDPMLAAVNALNLGENNQFAMALALLQQNRRPEAAEAAQTAAGRVVPVVLWFNFLSGFAYVAAGIGIALRRRWAAWLSIAIAVAIAAAFAVFALHVAQGAPYEMRTAAAMTLRLGIWTMIAWIAVRSAPQGPGPA